MAKTLTNIVLLDSTKVNGGIKRYNINYDEGGTIGFAMNKIYNNLSQPIKDKYDLMISVASSLLPAGTWTINSCCLFESIALLVYYESGSVPTKQQKIYYGDLIPTDKAIFDDFVNHVKSVDLL